MTAKALIAELSKMNPDAPVLIEIIEPYDDEPATLSESASSVTCDEHGNIIIS